MSENNENEGDEPPKPAEEVFEALEAAQGEELGGDGSRAKDIFKTFVKVGTKV